MFVSISNSQNMTSRTDVPDNAAEHCPGTTSEEAGKASSCAGCPNQTICSSGATKTVDPGIELVKERLKDVKNKLLILSGKGGVGKSTVTTMLSRAFAQKYNEKNFGVLDIDICGPSQPRMFGVIGEQVHQSGSGWSPVYVEDNLSIMSIGFLINSSDNAIIWRGPKKNGMIRQFLSEVDWGELDYLIIDTPPGTSDEHLSASTYLCNTLGNWGALLVTTPQEVSLLDVRKEITFCRKLKIPIVGVVENMSIFVCGKCSAKSEIFPAKTGGAQKMCEEMNVPFLGALPLDPKLTKSCDEGNNFIQDFSNSLVVQSLNTIVDKIIEFYN